MKKEFRGVIVGVLITAMLMSTVVFADNIKQNIEVIFNSVNITVNGEKVQANNILYNGTTYVPLKIITEKLNKEVEWDNTTNTVNIKDSKFRTVNVVRVVDGDTIEVDLNGKKEKVRFIGVDTPETVHPTKGEQPYGKEASNFTKAQLENKKVKLEFDVQERDRYGRLLAYVYVNDKMFNKTLLEEGYAKIATFPPNVKYVDDFTKLQKEARNNKKGLWRLENTEGDIQTQTEEKTEGKYVGSTDSDKYHLPTCRWAKKIKLENQIWFNSIEEAEKAGYKSCGVCNPK